jgi:hypothetical protein
MNKNVFPVVLFLIIAAAVVFYFTRIRKPSALREAQRSEQAGDKQKALSLYGAAADELLPSIAFPDINRSKIVTHELLKKEIEKYFIFITTPMKESPPEVIAAMEGLARCSVDDPQFNTISEPKITKLSPDEYLEEWNRSFFAPEAKIDPSHAALASGNYARNLSVLQINSVKNYTYQILFINNATCRGTRCMLYPESSVRFYAVPGEHTLLCRSTVTFPSGEIWRSPFTPITITIPSEPSLVTTELRTSVHRRKE